MKTILSVKPLVVFLFSISFWSTGQIDIYSGAPNLTTENLKGAVRSIEEKYFSDFEPLDRDNRASNARGFREGLDWDTKFSFDTLGNLIQVDYCSLGQIENSDIYTYKDGKLIESVQDVHHRLFKYDSLGRISTDYYLLSSRSGLMFRSEYALDEVYVTKHEHFYDASGNRTLRMGRVFDGDIKVDSFFYDERNRLINIRSSLNNSWSFEKMEYDSNGNLMQLSIGDDLFGLTENVSYTYKYNQLIEENRENFWQDRLSSRVMHQYENGNEIKIVEDLIDSEPSITEFFYDFDSMGNWITKMEVVKLRSGGSMVSIYTRKIEYY